MRVWALVATLSVALYGCTTTPVSVPVAPAPPPTPIAARPSLQTAQPGPWRITKTEWSKADEDGFGEFVRRIAESDCATTIACMQSAANFYHDSDPPFLFHADCAKWAYMLRAYYASKNGLPFSYVDRVASDGADPRFAMTSNRVRERRDIVDSGVGTDTIAVLKAIHDQVSTATFRMDAGEQGALLQDFYSPKIQPGSIHAGTAIYDINGHVMLVYEITADGTILYVDAHPDEAVTRGAYGPQVPDSPQALGPGFKNFRPLQLVGATLRADGSYIGGHVVLTANEGIADFSLEQYQGNAQGGARTAQYRYNGVPLDYYEYVRAAMSKGGYAFNPDYEMEVAMDSLCRDAKIGTAEADARVKAGLASLHADLWKAQGEWAARDLRVVYHGVSLKQSLAETYAEEEQACATSGDGAKLAAGTLDRFENESWATAVSDLIARIDDNTPFAGMRPVGY
jgi:hypothetical protein